MLVNLQTNHCIQITVRSTVETVKFILQNGSKFILTERFYQDPVEEYFVIQRQLGRRYDNPDVAKFCYNDNTVRIQTDVSFTSANIKGKYNKSNPRIEVGLIFQKNKKKKIREAKKGGERKYKNREGVILTFFAIIVTDTTFVFFITI